MIATNKSRIAALVPFGHCQRVAVDSRILKDPKSLRTAIWGLAAWKRVNEGAVELTTVLMTSAIIEIDPLWKWNQTVRHKTGHTGPSDTKNSLTLQWAPSLARGMPRTSMVQSCMSRSLGYNDHTRDSARL